MNTTRMQAPTTSGGSITVPLPCGHHSARLRSTDAAVRRCRTCRAFYLVKYLDGDIADVTDISCRTCLGEMDSMGDLWFCLRCGDEFSDDEVSGKLNPGVYKLSSVR